MSDMRCGRGGDLDDRERALDGQVGFPDTGDHIMITVDNVRARGLAGHRPRSGLAFVGSGGSWSSEIQGGTSNKAEAQGREQNEALARKLEHLDELLDAKTSHADNGAECPAVEFLVVRNDDLSERVVPAQHDMATFLPFDVETCLNENGGAFATGDAR
jgi:hypothetical protein